MYFSTSPVSFGSVNCSEISDIKIVKNIFIFSFLFISGKGPRELVQELESIQLDFLILKEIVELSQS